MSTMSVQWMNDLLGDSNHRRINATRSYVDEDSEVLRTLKKVERVERENLELRSRLQDSLEKPHTLSSSVHSPSKESKEKGDTVKLEEGIRIQKNYSPASSMAVAVAAAAAKKASEIAAVTAAEASRKDSSVTEKSLSFASDQFIRGVLEKLDIEMKSRVEWEERCTLLRYEVASLQSDMEANGKDKMKLVEISNNWETASQAWLAAEKKCDIWEQKHFEFKEQVETKLAHAQQELISATNQLKVLREEKNNVQSITEELNRSQEREANLNRKLEALLVERAQMESHSARLQNIISETRKECTRMETEMHTAGPVMERVRETLSRERRQVEALKKELDETRRNGSQLHNEMIQLRADANRSELVYEQENSKLRELISVRDLDVSTLSAERDHYAERATAAERETQGLLTKHQQIRSDVVSMANEYSALRNSDTSIIAPVATGYSQRSSTSRSFTGHEIIHEDPENSTRFINDALDHIGRLSRQSCNDGPAETLHAIRTIAQQASDSVVLTKSLNR